MKKLTILIIVCLFCVQLRAQQIVEKHIDFSGKDAVTLNIRIADSINILTWNKNEIYIKASINVNENKDNEAYSTSFKESGKTVVVDANFRENYFKGKKNCCNNTNIYWQVILPEKTRFSVETINANVTVNGKTRDLDVKSISGDIDVSEPAGKAAAIKFSTISGSIYSNHDLNPEKHSTGLPVVISDRLGTGGDRINLETISGNIFFRKSD
jgi:hypothetical protein